MSAVKEQNRPWLTLAILVHKPSPEYLNALFDSLVLQSGNYLVDIVDDSPEPHRQLHIPAGLGARYLRHQSNKHGLSGNWNFAVEHSRTHWITVLHQDDVLHPDYTSIIAELVARYPAATGVFCHASIVDENGNPTRTVADWVKEALLRRLPGPSYALHGEPGSVALLKGNFIFCPAVCFNRERLQGLSFDYRWRMVPDLALYLEMLAQGHELAGSKSIGMYYRRHAEQATSKYQATGLRFDEEFALYREYAKRYQDNAWHTAHKEARRATILRLHVAKEAVSRLLRCRFRSALRLVRSYL